MNKTTIMVDAQPRGALWWRMASLSTQAVKTNVNPAAARPR